MDETSLIKQAFSARNNAYAPYSGFTVGAALLCSDGTLYFGANIENAAYSPSLCAERVAFAKAIGDGQKDFSAIAVVGGQAELGAGQIGLAYPCGVCRQWMAEFCRENFKIIVAAAEDDFKVYSLKELLPHGFSPQNLS